jgi:hypothetical protein
MPNETVAAATLAAQSQLFHRLADALDEWARLIVAGDHEAFSEATLSPKMNEIVAVLAAARGKAAPPQPAPDPADLSEAVLLARAEWAAAHERLSHSRFTAQLLVERGLLFTQAMLGALGAAAGYGSDGRAAVAAGTNLQGRV